ncbi:hypothetical protein D3C81_2153390 [compost metagenome]
MHPPKQQESVPCEYWLLKTMAYCATILVCKCAKWGIRLMPQKMPKKLTIFCRNMRLISPLSISGCRVKTA